MLKQVLEDIQHLSVQQGRSGKLSSRSCPGQYKNSRTNDRADAKSRE